MLRRQERGDLRTLRRVKRRRHQPHPRGGHPPRGAICEHRSAHVRPVEHPVARTQIRRLRRQEHRQPTVQRRRPRQLPADRHPPARHIDEHHPARVRVLLKRSQILIEKPRSALRPRDHPRRRTSRPASRPRRRRPTITNNRPRRDRASQSEHDLRARAVVDAQRGQGRPNRLGTAGLLTIPRGGWARQRRHQQDDRCQPPPALQSKSMNAAKDDATPRRPRPRSHTRRVRSHAMVPHATPDRKRSERTSVRS